MAKRKKKPPFGHPNAIEQRYAAQLKRVARHSGAITKSHTDEAGLITSEAATYMAAMKAYSEVITPWANRVAAQMIEAVNVSNAKDWSKLSKSIGRELRKEYMTTAGGAKARAMHAESVNLIKSIPVDAAVRAQDLSREAMLGGRRPDEVAKMIAETGDVSASRATLIARTETAKANAMFTQARAQAIGADRYYWRSVEDESVRDSHVTMNGRSSQGESFTFEPPPEVDDDFGSYNPGEVPNCRCYAEPIVPGTEETDNE